MDVQLEFVPVFGVPNLDLLRSIPAEYLWSAQLADGAREPQGESLADDGLNYRAFAGEGDIPLVDVLRILAEKGNLRQAGPETFSRVADAMDPVEAGRRDGETTRAVLARAGIAVPKRP
ncbi:hypothetical protein [Micromonospora mirobrigensis]|nr:hypothetical protein [Micromonospora mirobrigensis]